jgi:hypothetical protein
MGDLEVQSCASAYRLLRPCPGNERCEVESLRVHCHSVLPTGRTTQAGTSRPGLVLAPSIRKTKRQVGELDRIWSEARGLRGIPIWLQSTLYWALGRTPPGLVGLRAPPAWYPGRPRPGFFVRPVGSTAAICSLTRSRST